MNQIRMNNAEWAIPKTVHDSLRQRYGVHAAYGINPGASGARILRCPVDENESLALRRYPKSTQLVRVDEIHKILHHASSRGCDIVPRILPLTRDTYPYVEDGYLWELSEWKPGSPLDADATVEQIASGARAIGEFHRATQGLVAAVKVCPAVSNRVHRIHKLDSLLQNAIDDGLRLTENGHVAFPQTLQNTLKNAAAFLKFHWADFRRSSLRRLKPFENLKVPCQYVLRDVHREHVLFSTDGSGRQRVTGIIDFDAIRIDCPETDLARWLSSFEKWWNTPEEVWATALAGYRRGSSLENRDQKSDSLELMRELVTLLADTGIMIGLANWLVWLIYEKRRFPSVLAIDERIAELCQFAKRGMFGGPGLDVEH